MLVSDQVFIAVKQVLTTAAGAAFPPPREVMPEALDGFRLRSDGLSDFLCMSSDGEAPREIARLQGGGGVDQIEAIVSIELIYTVADPDNSGTRRAVKSAALSAITAAVLAGQRLGGLAGYIRVTPAETDQDAMGAGAETAARLILSILVSGPEGQI